MQFVAVVPLLDTAVEVTNKLFPVPISHPAMSIFQVILFSSPFKGISIWDGLFAQPIPQIVHKLIIVYYPIVLFVAVLSLLNTAVEMTNILVPIPISPPAMSMLQIILLMSLVKLKFIPYGVLSLVPALPFHCP